MVLCFAAAAFSQVRSEFMQGTPDRHLVQYRAKQLKAAEALSTNLAYGRLVFEVRTYSVVPA